MDFHLWWKGGGRRRSILQEWYGRLPDEKNLLFERVRHNWHELHGMARFALNDSMELCRAGNPRCACAEAVNSAEFFNRLASSVVATCLALRNQGRHFGNLPVVAAMNPEHYRTHRARRLARRDQILHTFFASRSRLFHKLDSLAEAMEDLACEFNDVAADLNPYAARDSEDSWTLLDCLEYDLNSCLRETEVVFKSFLWALPLDQIPALQKNLETARLTLYRKSRPQPSYSVR